MRHSTNPGIMLGSDPSSPGLHVPPPQHHHHQQQQQQPQLQQTVSPTGPSHPYAKLIAIVAAILASFAGGRYVTPEDEAIAALQRDVATLVKQGDRITDLERKLMSQEIYVDLLREYKNTMEKWKTEIDAKCRRNDNG